MPTYLTPTLLIGAGPAGLAMAGRLAKLGLPFRLIEKGNKVGMAWHGHYDRLCLHTVKQHSALPHLPFPDEYPRYVSRLQLIAYLEAYIQTFAIEPMYGQDVISVRREAGQWITTTQTDTFLSERVVLATGYNRSPFCPTWPGQDTFAGTVLHSRDYRTGATFRGQTVLVVGMGNTGAELALDLHEQGAQPLISVRGAVNIVKPEFKGRPNQESAILLSKFPTWFYDWASRKVRDSTIGDLSAYGLPTSPLSPSEQIRKLGRIPVIDLGTVDLVKAGSISVVPDITRFNEHTVCFADGRELPVDAVVLATGYRPALTDFLDDTTHILNDRGYPIASWVDHPAADELYFIGFAVPATGILRSIYQDSAQIVRQIQKRC